MSVKLSDPRLEYLRNQQTLNALVSGQCHKLSGCEQAVCNDLFPSGVFPRPMLFANPRSTPVDRTVYPYGFYPAPGDRAWYANCRR